MMLVFIVFLFGIDGKEIFETQDPNVGWDGYCSNEKDGKCQQGGIYIN